MREVLFRDSHIAVVVKEPGELSQSDRSGEPGIPEKLSELCGGAEVYPVHRLDRPVGGVMVYACDKRSAAVLSAGAADVDGGKTDFGKEYLAVVSGVPDEKSGIMTDYIYKDGLKNKSFVCKTGRKGAKRAELEYEVLREYENAPFGASGRLSLIRVKLHTGRTHQIRVQFSSRGMPVAGDGKYGSRIKLNGEIALWSHRLSFCHPVTGERLSFTSQPDWAEK